MTTVLSKRVTRRVATTAVFVVAALVAPATARAQSFTDACNSYSHSDNPFFGIAVNGQCTDLSSLVHNGPTDGTYRTSGSYNIGGNNVIISAVWDTDPFITFSLATTNLVAGPVTYAFLFGTPIVPGMYSYARSSMGMSVTSGDAGSTTAATSSIYPTFLSGYGTVNAAATNLNVDAGTGTCSATIVTTVCNYGPSSSTFAPTFYNNLEALVTYTQTDVNSAVSISGRIDLLELPPQVVPEPSTYLLVAAGLGALGAIAKRRKGNI